MTKFFSCVFLFVFLITGLSGLYAQDRGSVSGVVQTADNEAVENATVKI
ncbi:MAG: hypothetical protein MUQ00_09380 [Candidatus Aminicenantes bacterium]|nr:hypothetical protein [Candidatus Aminicenantes bacterium]